MNIDPKKYGMTTGEVIDQAAQLLQEGHGIWVDKEFDNCSMLIKNITFADLQKLDQDDSKMHCVCLEVRPGAHLFYSYLEYTYFPPEQPANNKLFEYRIVKWHGHLWQIGSVPKSKKSCCEATAAKARMKLQDSVPFVVGIVIASTRDFDNLRKMVGDAPVDIFPMRSKRVFTLENGKGQPIQPTAEQRKWEMEELQKIYAHQDIQQNLN